HMPAFVPRRELRLQVQDADRRCLWAGNYLLIEGLLPGQQVTLTFPISENTFTYTAAAGSVDERAFSCTFRGSTLVDILPQDDGAQNYKLYQRAGMRAGKAPLQERERYVGRGAITHW
ncbi:MAG: hypothetical protein LLG44_13765, partial [Chloroflexi bacterium]|nr:hypothetical protein [Chloroflexota bacterium]